MNDTAFPIPRTVPGLWIAGPLALVALVVIASSAASRVASDPALVVSCALVVAGVPVLWLLMQIYRAWRDDPASRARRTIHERIAALEIGSAPGLRDFLFLHAIAAVLLTLPGLAIGAWAYPSLLDTDAARWLLFWPGAVLVAQLPVGIGLLVARRAYRRRRGELDTRFEAEAERAFRAWRAGQRR